MAEMRQRTSIQEVTRVPIVGAVQRVAILNVTRVPITGITRAAVATGETLSWDEIYEKLVNYIKFAAKQVSEQYGTQSDSVADAEDLFQEGQLLLYHCYTIYKHKPINEFSALFKASLWRKLRELAKKNRFIQVDIEDAYDLGYSDNVVEDIYEEYKLQQMAEMLESTPIALTILKEFVNPSTRTTWEASMDVARKQTLKDQNFAQAVPKEIVIKGVHIQRALEIPKTVFNDNFRIVKNIVSHVYSLDKEQPDEDYEEVLQNCV